LSGNTLVSISGSNSAPISAYGGDDYIIDNGTGNNTIYGGSGNDLVSLCDVPAGHRDSVHEGDCTYLLSTAGGITESSLRVHTQVGATDENIEPLLLDSTPPVMSVGYRCVELGFGFHWYPFSHKPYYDLPQGGKA
jgi:hypothetical protein